MTLRHLFAKFLTPRAALRPATAPDTDPKPWAWTEPPARTTLEESALRTDAMVQTALTVKRLGILAADAEWTGGEATVRDFLTASLDQMNGSLETVLENAMAAFADGWSLQEVLYRSEGDRLVIDRVEPRDTRQFRLEFDGFGQPVGLLQLRVGEPDLPLPLEKFIVYRYRPDAAHPYGRSDLVTALPHAQNKAELMAEWQTYLRKFAMPTLVGSFDRNVTGDEQEALLQALRDPRRARAILIPNDMQISPLQLGSAASQGYLEAIEFHNREIARSILGQTLTTDEGRRVGSLALGRVHLQVLLLQLASLRKELADRVVTEQMARPLVRLNFGDQTVVPRYRFRSVNVSAFATGDWVESEKIGADTR